MGGASLALLGTSAPGHAATGERRFDIIRDGDVIGHHSVIPSLSGDELTLAIDIQIAVKILGLTVYRYAHQNTERWRGGTLLSLNARTDDDGEAAFCKVMRGDDAFMVEGSSFKGQVPLTSGTTSYWNADALSAPVWISTQSGSPLAIDIRRQAPQGGLTPWRISGDLDLTLYYDAAMEWRGSAFEARGTEIRLSQTRPGMDLAARR
ncbi:MAG: DUF6134 family protein [Neomegalonema sp.]|nr:DUF6134 family protein [Neomegalonema sp.]